VRWSWSEACEEHRHRVWRDPEIVPDERAKSLSQATVSIIVPTYDRATLLPRALDSIVAQTFNDWEIVLVDDGSTDNTGDVAAEYGERLNDRFLFIRQPNQGASAARNAGIDACGGRFVAFLDSDDEFLPTKLECQLELFDRRPELGLVYSDYAFIDLDGVRHESMFDTVAPLAREVQCQTVAPDLCVCTGDVFDVLLRGYFIPTIVGVVRREVLGNSIRFPVGQDYAEEWLFYLRVAKSCRAGFVDKPLCLHHFTAGSLARTDKQRNTARMCDLLMMIDRTFEDLSRAQRRTVHRQLAAAFRQMGFDEFRSGRYTRATRHFAEALCRRPQLGTLVNTAEAGVRALLSMAVSSPTPSGERRRAGHA